jgi:glycosyltransferase involved in cell wall biosynthesis
VGKLAFESPFHAIVGVMILSVVIPAYNEEKYLARTLEAVRLALALVADAEIIVVDNRSTDATRDIAKSFGAKIAEERVHNIAKVRNMGGLAAEGEVLVFLDADTLVAPGLFEKIIEAMSDAACVGGSVAVEYEAPRNRQLFMRLFIMLWTFLGRLTKMRQGALQFCRSAVFRELGGYDSTIYVGEDIEFHWRLDKLAKKRGGITAFIEEPKVQTSSRRWEKMGLIRMLFFTHPITIFLAWRIRSFWKDWYENAVR